MSRASKSSSAALPRRPDQEFKLSITKALGDQLLEALEAKDGPTRAPLEDLESLKLDSKPGVYFLFLDDVMVYVGKASRSLPARLAKHARKISGRSNFGNSEVTFVCLYVDEDLEASAPEKMLLSRFERDDQKPAWNTNGFGNNDPGKQRDTSLVAENHFDALHPIDLGRTVDVPTGKQTVEQVLKAAKKQLPFNLRYARAGRDGLPAATYRVPVVVPKGPLGIEQLFDLVLSALGPDWQATALPGYLILYREHKVHDSAHQYWRFDADAGVVKREDGPGKRGESKVTDDDDFEKLSKVGLIAYIEEHQLDVTFDDEAEPKEIRALIRAKVQEAKP